MMSDIGDSASPREVFEMIGNDPTAWADRAAALLTSAAVLNAQYTEPPKDDPDAFWEFFKLHIVAMMLKGMALECLLKAVWVARVSPLVTEGKFRPIPGTKDHDLLSLVAALRNHVEISLSKEEEELLPVLSNAIISGRYPVRKSVNTRPSKPEWVERMRWCKWEIPADDARFASIVAKIYRHIDEDTEGDAPAECAAHAMRSVPVLQS